MPRPRRLNIPDIPQHVTQRGNNRQPCFFRDKDRQTYLSLLETASQRRECAVHAYVLMTNHVHLLVTPTTPDGISRLMQDIGREFVRYINRSYQRSGTLWEGRFRSCLVDSDSYCLACYRYIELNPVRAALVEGPGEYRWSSYRANALGVADPLIKPHERWLSLGHNANCRYRAYRKLFSNQLPTTLLSQIRHQCRKGLPLGARSFKKQIESQLQIKLGDGKVGRPAKSE